MCHFISRTIPVAFVISLLLSVSVVAAQPASSRRVEVTLNEGTSMAIALSPDGTTLAIDLLGALWTVSVVGGPARRITDELSDARQPAWFPDGKTITFQSYRLGSWDIWAVGADGTDLRQETWGPFDDREPHVSPDGPNIPGGKSYFIATAGRSKS